MAEESHLRECFFHFTLRGPQIIFSLRAKLARTHSLRCYPSLFFFLFFNLTYEYVIYVAGAEDINLRL